MNVITKLVTTGKVLNCGIWEGKPYDLYKQTRHDARHDRTQHRYIRRYYPFVDNSLEGVSPQIMQPVEKTAWLFEPLD